MPIRAALDPDRSCRATSPGLYPVAHYRDAGGDVVVREAREQLPRVLERFRKGGRTPVGVGSHRKAEALMVPVEVFEELIAERARSLSQAVGSVRAEGLEVGMEVQAVTERWVRGEISTVQMRELVRRLYDVP